MTLQWKLFPLAALLLSGCSTVILVKSSWNPNKIVIDGEEEDWNDRTIYLDEQNLSLGICNDTNYFYLYVKPLDREQVRHIRAGGLTVWLDTEGGDDKVFGMRIPGKPMRPGEWAEENFEMLNGGIEEVEILQKGNEHPFHLPVAQLNGIQIGSSMNRDAAMFEFRIPRTVEIEGAAALDFKNKEIGVGIETAKSETPRTRGEGYRRDRIENEGENTPEGMGDEGGRPEGRRGGGRSRRNVDSEKKSAPLDFWFKVRLSGIK